MALPASMAYLLPGVPVSQPVHLEGDSELATEILPGPPSLVSIQQGIAVKRDPRKPAISYSYLPLSDPGSTYSGVMHGTLVGQDAGGKRSRDQAAASRAQRATARQQNGSTSVPEASTSKGTSVAMIIDDNPAFSRSNSSQNGQEAPSASSKRSSRKKEKGKRHEIETSSVRVKEEPMAVSLTSPEPSSHVVPNDDHCSSCRSFGALIYCDGCPRAFHLCCVDPPLEPTDVGDSKWFCPACNIHKVAHPRRPASLLSPLFQVLDTSIPTEFHLPDDIKSFFKDVASGERGAYIDSSTLKPPRLNRHGQLEDRDTHRLRDRNGQPVLCFRCGTSSLSDGVVATVPSSKRVRRSTAKAAQYAVWKNIISCDYCDLHWHLDCLDPPLSTMPSFTKKWMCPNHSEHILPPRKRIPKQHVSPIDITSPRQFNNGNIEVIRSQPVAATSKTKPKVNVDEVLINGRRYRVPERVILLDFWNKISSNPSPPPGDDADVSAMSSPLTELSSLDELDDHPVNDVINEVPELGDYEVAMMLCNLRSGVRTLPAPRRRLVNSSVQTDLVLPQRPQITQIATSSLPKPRILLPPKAPSHGVAAASGSSSAPPPKRGPGARAKLKKPATTVTPEASDRELRSKNRSSDSVPTRSTLRNSDDSRELSSLSSVSTPVNPRSRIRIKMEEDIGSLLLNGSSVDSPVTPTIKRGPGRPRKRVAQDPAATEGGDGRRVKRKKDEPTTVETAVRTRRTPVATTPRSWPVTSISAAPASPSPSGPPPGTPSLKIRLPAHRPALHATPGQSSISRV